MALDIQRSLAPAAYIHEICDIGRLRELAGDVESLNRGLECHQLQEQELPWRVDIQLAIRLIKTCMVL